VTEHVLLSEIEIDQDANISRRPFAPHEVDDLAEQIKEMGQRVPAIVRPWGKNGFKYRLVCGYRRAAACKLLGIATLYVDIQEMTDHEANKLNVIENLERKNLSLWEEAVALGRLYPEGKPCREVAQELKRPTRWVNTRFRLLEMQEPIQKAAAAGLLSVQKIDIISRLKKPEDQLRCLDQILKAMKKGNRKDYHRHLDPKFHRHLGPKRPRPSKDEVMSMITEMLSATIVGIGPRALAYTQGIITREELMEDIKALKQKSLGQKSSAGVVPVDEHHS
jgi:ParB/RepB/Spo0J family partition protein